MLPFYNKIFRKQMLKKIYSNIVDLLRIKHEVRTNHKQVLENRVLVGSLYNEFNINRSINKINELEFKVFSQYGDDGIICYLAKKLHFENKFFVEFGVDNYVESNTRFY